MKKFHFSRYICVLSILGFVSAKPPVDGAYKYNCENVLGTSFELKVTTASESTADLAEQTALGEIDRLNKLLSTYDPDSEISRWLKTCHSKEIVSPELFEVFTLFDHWRNKTNGALNASAAIASNLWKKAMLSQRLPGDDELSGAVIAMNEPQWVLSTSPQTAVHLSDQPLVLNSFVKSYILHKVSEKLMDIAGVTGAVINIGGDIIVAGVRDEIVRIADPMADAENANPLAILNVQDRAIATSGNYRRGFQIGKQWFSHILDVRTALPVSEIISATVVAKDATDAGALATAFNILLPQESAVLAESIPGVEYMIVTKTGKEIVSDGWSALFPKHIPQPVNQLKNHPVEKQYEVSIEVELARFEGRFHRPFVAIWLEGKKKESVRTLTLWFNKSRWLPELKRWFSKNQVVTQDPAALGSISSATRSAGRYTLVWDGLDDAGKALPPGKYTLYIEAAREHGTYQLLKQDIDWKGKPDHFDLNGGVEITSASIDLHVKTTQ